MPFEIVEEDVLGERLRVFANRAHSIREILLGADRFGDRDCYVFGDGSRLAFDRAGPAGGVVGDRAARPRTASAPATASRCARPTAASG